LFGASINHVKQWLKAYSFFDVLKVDESKERRIIEVKRERERERILDNWSGPAITVA
jgi:hypothetical protein